MPHRSLTGFASQALALALLAIPAAAVPAERGGPELTFSGVQRTRYEALNGQLLSGLNNRDEVLALQTSLVFAAKLRAVRLVGEILDSRAELNDVGSFVNGTVVDSLEPIQAFVEWTATDLRQTGSESTLRVGRMTLDVGKRRLLSRNRFRNTVNNFLGADWQWRGTDGRAARAFYFTPLRPLPNDLDSLLDNEPELDRAFRDTAIIGGYYQFPKLPGGHILETTIADYQLRAAPSDTAAAADHISLGFRAYRPPAAGRWHYETEAIAQAGESGANVAGVPHDDLRHHAYFLHAEIGYGFPTPWSPTLTLQYDRASGDHDPLDERNERFNTLFGDRRFDFGPTGIYGPFQRSNLDTPGLRLTFNPNARWQGMVSYRSLRLASSTDTWVGVGYRDESGDSGRSLGRQLEASLLWTAIPGRLTLDMGFAALRLGRFGELNRDPTFSGEPRYYYAAVTTTF